MAANEVDLAQKFQVAVSAEPGRASPQKGFAAHEPLRLLDFGSRPAHRLELAAEFLYYAAVEPGFAADAMKGEAE
ncbi:MAG: hypothetical protein WAM82_14870 [Thermoanaerobaculia bacterium]